MLTKKKNISRVTEPNVYCICQAVLQILNFLSSSQPFHDAWCNTHFKISVSSFNIFVLHQHGKFIINIAKLSSHLSPSSRKAFHEFIFFNNTDKSRLDYACHSVPWIWVIPVKEDKNYQSTFNFRLLYARGKG